MRIAVEYPDGWRLYAPIVTGDEGAVDLVLDDKDYTAIGTLRGLVYDALPNHRDDDPTSASPGVWRAS